MYVGTMCYPLVIISHLWDIEDRIRQPKYSRLGAGGKCHIFVEYISGPFE